MVKSIKILFCFVVFLIWQQRLSAQLSGTYNVPSNFATISAAISALNTQGVSGPVIIEINAGYTETVSSGGYSLTATGTAINSITFQKTGVGANPILVAYSGGVGTPASAVQDGVWRFIGSDYITIDGIDIIDQNVSNPSTMEYGFGFFRASNIDGCQNNTIKNCNINLKVLNNANATGTSVEGSRGIHLEWWESGSGRCSRPRPR